MDVDLRAFSNSDRMRVLWVCMMVGSSTFSSKNPVAGALLSGSMALGCHLRNATDMAKSRCATAKWLLRSPHCHTLAWYQPRLPASLPQDSTFSFRFSHWAAMGGTWNFLENGHDFGLMGLRLGGGGDGDGRF